MSPSLIKRAINHPGQFACDTATKGMWFWGLSRDLPYQSNPIFEGKYLYYNKLTLKHNGYYFCYGTSKKYNQFFWARGKLKVYGT